MNKEPFFWDNYSDQPQVIKDKAYKKTMRKKHFIDFLKLFFSSLFILPVAIFVMKFFKGKVKVFNEEFIGIGVNLDKGSEQIELVEELGVKNLIIRMPLWDIKNIDLYVDFAQSFNKKSHKNILLNIIQDRENIENKKILNDNLELVFSKFSSFVNEYQIATAINRAKWGFFSVSEYFDFYKVAQNIKEQKFPNIKLLGPSVIDFEYYYNVRAMFNFEKIKYDKVSSLLYVDRRGSPKNAQSFFFDLKNKIDFLYSLVKLSPKCENEIYITEVNWPILNTAPYTPTSQKEAVNLEDYTKYMLDYFKIARESRKIKRVYWHQLVASGYGLVDNREGKIVKYPQFYALKEMIQSEKLKVKN